MTLLRRLTLFIILIFSTSIKECSTKSSQFPLLGEFVNNYEIIDAVELNISMLHDLNSQRAVYAIQNKTLDERLVILICDRVCHDEREGIPRIIRQLQKDLNIPKTNAISFHFLLKKEKIEAYNIEKMVKFETKKLLYFVGEKGFPYNGSLKSKDIYEWLEKFETINKTILNDYNEIDTFITSIDNDISNKFDLIYFHFQKTYNCPAYGQNSFENAIRSLQNENVEFVLFDNLLTTEINVILDIRLPDIYRKTCPILLLCHKGKYKEIPLILSPKIVRKFVEHAMANYYEIENEWSKIKAPLTEIQLQYLVDEYNIVKIQWNRNLMIAGFIGGIATLVLGISIFWGLDGT